MKESYDISSAQSADTLYSRLKGVTLVQPRFQYLRWIDDPRGRLFYGELDHRRFKLSRYLEGRNFFTPVIEGELLETESGCTLHYEVTSSPDMKMARVFLGIVLCIYLAALLIAINAPSVFRGDRLFLKLYPFGWFGVAVVFRLLNKYNVKKIKKDVFESLRLLAEG